MLVHGENVEGPASGRITSLIAHRVSAGNIGAALVGSSTSQGQS